MRDFGLSSGALVLLLCASAYAGTTTDTAGPSERAGAALDRAALVSRSPTRAVLMGAAQAGQRLIAVGERGIVALSDDGGGSWRQVATPTSVTLTAVRFFDEAHGLAVGHGGTVLGTADGGQTWVRRLDGRQIATLEVDAAKVGGDAAQTKFAERLRAEGPDKPLLDVLMLDAKRALVVGAYGLAYATSDAGATWTSWRRRLDNPKELHLYAVRQSGDRIVMAGEQGLLLLSADGGQSFRRLLTPYEGSFFTAELLANDSILVAGLRGNVWRSTDSGRQWEQLPSPVPASVTASAVRPDGSVLLVNQAGLLMAVGAGGAGLTTLQGRPLPPLNAVLPLDGLRTLVLSNQGLQLLSPPAEARGGKAP